MDISLTPIHIAFILAVVLVVNALRHAGLPSKYAPYTAVVVAWAVITPLVMYRLGAGADAGMVITGVLSEGTMVGIFAIATFDMAAKKLIEAVRRRLPPI